jgi:hypothetical protein
LLQSEGPRPKGPDFSGPLLPVAGKVIVNGKPLTQGSVTFLPDAAKGNKQPPLTLIGMIGTDGEYNLVTIDNRRGAPAGWYKVTVQSQAPPSAGDTSIQTRPAVTIPPKYRDMVKTPLSVEVKAGAGASDYDLVVK